jgi:Swiss Army Knife RNA repair-like protein
VICLAAVPWYQARRRPHPAPARRVPRVVFLDFDGVLNSARWFRDRPADGEGLFDGYLENIDPAAVALVQGVVDETGAVVVVSSAWRVQFNASTLFGMLRLRGFRGTVVGNTPVLGVGDLERGAEVRAWLSRHDASAWVILDDCDEGMAGDPHLVRTTWEEGLTPELADRAVAVLLGGVP